MKIAVVGMGYVGSVTAAVLAEAGNSIYAVDIDPMKIESLKNGKPLIHEPGLEEILQANKERFTFSTSYEGIRGCDICILCVPTPNSSGRIELKYVLEAAKRAGEIKPGITLVIKSTVLPGTASRVASETKLTVVSNPEFTSEGRAVNDTRHPNRIVIGSGDSGAAQMVADLWKFTASPVLITNNANAELIKYASNSFLATKISFINEIANLCEKIPGADVSVVAKGMGYDRRIGSEFLRAGLGYGGSCFPKDTQALIGFASDMNERLSVVEAAMTVNSAREQRVLDLCKSALGGNLDGGKICVLGLSFKNDTDDLRESKSLTLISKLEGEGAQVRSFDPIVKGDSQKNRCDTLNECVSGSELVVIATEWPEFKESLTDFHGTIVDARRILDPGSVTKYRGVGLYSG